MHKVYHATQLTLFHRYADYCFRCGNNIALLYSSDVLYIEEDVPIIGKVCSQCYLQVKFRVMNFNMRAKCLGNRHGLKVSEWLEILRASYGYCSYCKRPVGYRKLLIEHIISISRGGANTVDNVVPACPRCNSKKSSREVLAWLKMMGLHPDPALLILIERSQRTQNMSRSYR